MSRTLFSCDAYVYHMIVSVRSAISATAVLPLLLCIESHGVFVTRSKV